jgi:hypothetical protein
MSREISKKLEKSLCFLENNAGRTFPELSQVVDLGLLPCSTLQL